MTDPNLRLLALGAGRQSTVLALMAASGELPGCDGAIFADTGWEPARVYDHLARIEAVLSAAGIPLYRVSQGNLRRDAVDPEHRYASIPYYVRNPDGSQGMGRRQCTSEYKLKPISRKVRELLGAEAPHYRRVPRGRVAEVWIGFAREEIGRVNDDHGTLYERKRFPLIEMDMSTNDCLRWLRVRGWDGVAKSACIGCPYHGNRAWRELRDNDPEGWADAVAFDAAIRKGGGRGTPLDGQAFLHRSRVPLPLAPLDRLGRADAREAQVDMFELAAEVDADAEREAREAEEGAEGTCSPYGCHSDGNG